jgi:hypothetical protein
MNGNFTRINLESGGTKAKVEGWLVWADGDESAELHITVTQGSLTLPADDPVPVTPNLDKWEATITANGGPFLTKGLAAGIAGATVTSASGQSPQNWSSSPLQVN